MAIELSGVTISRPLFSPEAPTISSGGVASADTAAANLRTQPVRQVWRSSHDGQTATWFQALIPGKVGVRKLHAISLVNHNCFSGNTGPTWRIRVASTDSPAIVTSPASISNLVNLTGSVSDISSDPGNPAATKLTATSHTSSTAVDVQLASHSYPYRSGVATQTVFILVGHSTGTGTAASVTYSLYEGATLKATLGTFSVPTSGVGVHSVSFDPSLLSTLMIAPIIRISGTAGSTGTVEPHALMFQADVTGMTFDTTVAVSMPAPGSDHPETVDALYVFSSPITLASMVSYHVHVHLFNAVTDEGYIQAGYFEPFIDPIDLGLPESGGITLSWQGGASVRYGLGNSPHNKPLPMYRLLEANFTQQLESQAVLVALDQLARDLGTKRDAVFILRPAGSSDFIQATSFFGRFIEGGTPTATHMGYGKGSDGDEPRYNVRFTARESR